jgi:hypothetical protein
VTEAPPTSRRLRAQASSLFARLAYRVRHFHVENKGLKLLSLLLAFLLFAVSRQPQREVLLPGVPIIYANVPPGLEISGDVPATASVRLRGPQDVVRSITANQLEIVANLSGKLPGERAVQLKPGETDRENVRVLRIEPASVELRLEPTRRKQVPVEARFTGQPAPGFERYGHRVEPSAVEIEGPESRVARVTRVQTESVSLDGRRETFTANADLDLHQQGVRALAAGPFRFTAEIGEQRAERMFVDVPVAWPDQPPQARLLTPRLNVTLRGPRSVIGSLKAEDVKAEIRTAGVPEMVEHLRPKISWPAEVGAKVELVSVNPVEVKLKR